MRVQESIGKMGDRPEANKKIKELEQNDDFMLKLAEEAEKGIREELKLPPFQIRREQDFET